MKGEEIQIAMEKIDEIKRACVIYNEEKSRIYGFYMGDIDKKEIDLLIVKNDSITPIEIKRNKYPEEATKNFSALYRFKMKINKGLIICLANDFIPYDKTASLCPVSAIL